MVAAELSIEADEDSDTSALAFKFSEDLRPLSLTGSAMDPVQTNLDCLRCASKKSPAYGVPVW
jgi:hypothetical protein